jgi:hypothetical protein
MNVRTEETIADFAAGLRSQAAERGFAILVVVVDNASKQVAYCTNLTNRRDAVTLAENTVAAFERAAESTFRAGES